jgi:hypothetical protein
VGKGKDFEKVGTRRRPTSDVESRNVVTIRRVEKWWTGEGASGRREPPIRGPRELLRIVVPRRPGIAARGRGGHVVLDAVEEINVHNWK